MTNRVRQSLTCCLGKHFHLPAHPAIPRNIVEALQDRFEAVICPLLGQIPSLLLILGGIPDLHQKDNAWTRGSNHAIAGSAGWQSGSGSSAWDASSYKDSSARWTTLPPTGSPCHSPRMHSRLCKQCLFSPFSTMHLSPILSEHNLHLAHS